MKDLVGLLGRLCCLVVLLITLPASGQIRVTLRNAAGRVEAAYDGLSSLNDVERQSAFRQLPAAMQDDVWMFHLERFLNAHEDLTDDEQALIYAAIGFLATGPAGMSHSDPSWQARVGRPLGDLERRARTSCRHWVARQAFARLGPDKASESPHGLRAHPNAGRSLFGPCTCSVDHDWCCILPTCPEKCTGVSCDVSTEGCGFLWKFPCDGMCF